MKHRYRYNIKNMMADCETNYVRLGCLLPVLKAAYTASKLHDASISDSQLARQFILPLSEQQSAQILIEIRETCPYTTTINFCVDASKLKADEHKLMCSNMSVRLYHDVRMAEVIAVNAKRSKKASYDYPNDYMFQPDEKTQQNRFLGEWLERCLKEGYDASTCVHEFRLVTDNAKVLLG